MKTTYYCPRGCNVFETDIDFGPRGPDCANCGRDMTTNQDVFEAAHERRDIERMEAYEREMAKYHVQFVPIRDTSRWGRHFYKVHPKNRPDLWVMQTNPDCSDVLQRRAALIAAEALSKKA